MKTIDLSASTHQNNNTDYNFTVFTRKHGVSPAPFDSCNVSLGVGDSSENVQANRQLIKKELQLDVLISGRQVHNDQIYIINNPPSHDSEFDGYDALVTDCPNIGLMIQQADCQAVMLYDPAKKVIANVHAGWRGSVLNIVSKTIQTMVKEFDVNPINIVAAISPSLGPCCAEFVNYKKELPGHFYHYQNKSNHFNFWDITKDQLCTTGVSPNNISTAGICTVCEPDFFSYRRDKTTGRFCSVVSMKDS